MDTQPGNFLLKRSPSVLALPGVTGAWVTAEWWPGELNPRVASFVYREASCHQILRNAGECETPTLVQEHRAEIWIGLVGAIGSPLSEAAAELTRKLKSYDYASTSLRVSQSLTLLPLNAPKVKNDDPVQRYRTAMEAGTWAREQAKRGDVLLAPVFSQAVKTRLDAGLEPFKSLPAHCFIVRSLKHPDEVDRLRAIHRRHFILIAVHASEEDRIDALCEEIAQAKGKEKSEYRSEALNLIAIDESERGRKLGQNVRETFAKADVFVSGKSLAQDIERTLKLLFGAPFITPSREEQGMFFAQSAALRSAALSRQVGACIASQEGDVLTVGCNEVPKAHGGQYWGEDRPDYRDFQRNGDQNDRLKHRAIVELVSLLKQSAWIPDAFKELSDNELAKKMLSKSNEGDIPNLRNTRLGVLTEFGRDVHAEMSAITTAARHGIRVHGAVLFTTTYPCHNCAKHILASGISRVVYIEPYDKSFALESHADGFTKQDCDDKVFLSPFVGVGPRRYEEWFKFRKRKDGHGNLVEWLEQSAEPVFSAPELGGNNQASLEAESFFSKDLLEQAYSLLE